VNIKPLKAIIDTLSAATHGTAERPGAVSPPCPPGRKNTATANLALLSPRARMGVMKSFVAMHNDYSVADLRELSRVADRKADEMERQQ